MPDAVPAPPPDTLSRLAKALGEKYQVRRLVGRGGFAEVYEVWDRELERRLAVKVLRPDVAWTAGTLERFQRETRAIAKLEHPNILAIHFVGQGDGLVYYAMPYVEGLSLGDLLRRSGALPPDRALAIVVPVLDALQHAHEAGLLHRDIKPDNIMLDAARGRPLLVDFGIARRLDAEAGLTQTGLVVGTPHYMSPEQALGDPNLDARSDLYAMGAVLFQMVTGSPPFDGDSSQEIVGKHIAEPPPAARDVNPKIPRWLSDTITRCLQKQPADRFQSAAEVLAALEADEAGGGRGAPSRAISAQRAIASLTTAAKTEQVASGTPARKRADATVPLKRSGTTAGGRTVRRLVAIALPLVALAAALFWLSLPRLVFQNQLTAPVVVRVDGQERTVAPGTRFTERLARGRRGAGGPLEITWKLVRPSGPDGVPLGIQVADTVSLASPPRRVRVTAGARPGARAYFAPLITNNTGRPVRVIVNAGFVGALACDCTVPAGAVRMAIGYYPLFANSTVRAEDADRHAATFRDLGPQVDPASGLVRLEFRAGDLR